MTKLLNALNSWGTDSFKKTLKQELENLEPGVLPLHKATQLGGKVDDANISALINSVSDDETSIKVQVGIFFDEIMGGCSCGDEPPSENTYCELQLSIDKTSAETTVSLS